MTEVIKVKRETVEEWKVIRDPSYILVHEASKFGKGFCYSGEWQSYDAPPEVRAAAERFWEQIRPLKSGTSDDGSPWGEVRVEGEAPVRCGYEDGELPFADVNGRQMHNCDVDPFLWWSTDKSSPKDTWAAPAAKWFAANPWPVKPVIEPCHLEEQYVIASASLELMRQDRDAWKERAEKAASESDGLRDKLSDAEHRVKNLSERWVSDRRKLTVAQAALAKMGLELLEEP